MIHFPTSHVESRLIDWSARILPLAALLLMALLASMSLAAMP